MDVAPFITSSCLSIEDFDKHCRLCLSQSKPLISILENMNNIPLELSTCLSIEVNCEDLLPKFICEKCANNLQAFYTFYINSKHCERWLLDCLTNQAAQIATESPFLAEQMSNRENLKSPCESEFLAEFLDSSNNSFDMELLTNDSNTFTALEYLTSENQTPNNVANKLVNSGIKVTKVTNVKGSSFSNPPDDSYEIHMEIDVLDSDLDIVNELLSKQSRTTPLKEKNNVSSECYSCMSCKIIFNDFERLANHMGSCEALKRTCVDCGNLFETKEKMLKHRIVHNTTQACTCHHCGKHFLGIDRLNQHIEKCHSDFVAEIGCVYKCRECGSIFQSKDKLYVHAKSHVKLKLNMNSVHFVCEDCGNVYSNKANLQNHRKLQHGGPNFVDDSYCVFRCKVCAKVFGNRNQLYSHIKQHTNIFENTQHLCDSCGKSFNSYNGLSRHVLTHVGNKFECSICKKQFINGSLLKKHLSSHEIETQVCEVCGLIFSNDVLLNIHHDEHISN